MGSTGARPPTPSPLPLLPCQPPPPNSPVDAARRMHGAYNASCGDVGGGLMAGGLVLKGKSGGMSTRFRESAGLTDGFRLCLGSMCVDVNIGFNSLWSLFPSHFKSMGYSIFGESFHHFLLCCGPQGSPQASAWLSLCYFGRPDPCPLGPGGRVFASLSNEVNNPAF